MTGPPSDSWSAAGLPRELAAPLSGCPVVTRVEVAWGDMDAFGHVNNARFFAYMESGRLRYFERMGVARLDHSAAEGTILASAACRFKAPITYPDVLWVGTTCTDVGRDRFTLESRLASERHGRVAAIGSGVVVAYDHGAKSKIALPGRWRDAIAALEAAADGAG